MENKTAIQTLATIIEDRIGVSIMADQSKEAIVGYQMALVGIKLELKKLLELERKQIIQAWTDGCTGELWELNIDTSADKYYKETYGKNN